MEPPPKPPSTSLFQVYLRLRPAPSSLVQLTQQSLYPLLAPPERYLTVEPPAQDIQDGMPTHITIRPPTDSRKRAVEKFAFTKVFEEEASQLDIFRGTGVMPLVEGVLGEGRDGLLATLGVTGSGKSHTILGSRSQRGLTQLSLDLLYRSLDQQTLHPSSSPSLISSLNATDVSEGQILSASNFLDGVYGDCAQERNGSRAPTPMMVGNSSTSSSKNPPLSGPCNQWSILGLSTGSLGPGTEKSSIDPPVPTYHPEDDNGGPVEPRALPFQPPAGNVPRLMRTPAKLRFGNSVQDPTFVPSVPKRGVPQRPSALPQFPDIRDLYVPPNPNTEYAVVVSMYEVYNDRIFDLLSHPRSLKDLRRRPLLFKSTESSPDRKVVAGLRKIVCGSYDEALMVLETGLMERRVAGTGSNSVSSRSHGFFCVEVKRRPKGGMSTSWSGAQLTIVDLAGSERARNAKTAGATLAEAGKINESLMYLGQCLQMQSDCHDGTKPSIVPFRQCKLTELLFSNSFPSSSHHSTHPPQHHRNAQKAIMIVTADPLGDFNATSQILRYSALAREVTVPRIPSVSSTILSGTAINTGSQKAQLMSGRTSPNSVIADEGIVEMAFSEIARLTEEVEILKVKLADEHGRRKEAEEGWQKAEEKSEEIEREVREECWEDMERKTEEERRRWMNAWGEEADRNDEHLDRKLEILTQGIQIHEDTPSPTTHTIDLETENQTLRRKLDLLEREMHSHSPTRSQKKKEQYQPWHESSLTMDDDEDDFGTTLFQLNSLTLNSEKALGVATSPAAKKTLPAGKKVRKFTARKWDLGDENELDGYGGYH